MNKPTAPLSLYPKLIFGFMYVYVALSVLLIGYGLFDQSYLAGIDHLSFFVSTTALIILAVVTLYALHTRKKSAALLVILTVFLSYGLDSLALGDHASVTFSLSSFVSAAAFLVADTCAIVYVLTSKEMKTKFTKAW